MVNGTQMTLEEFMPGTFRKQTVGVLGSPVRTSALPTGCSLDFKETALRSSSELCTFLDKPQKKKDPLTCSLRTLKICLVLIGDGILPDFSLNWMGGGYDAEWQVLDSKNFGVPQHRERVFIVGCSRRCGRSKIFPVGTDENKNKVLQIAEYDVARKNSNSYRVYSPDGIAPTITAVCGGGRMPSVRLGEEIRRLTPKEHFRLQGWDDRYFEKAKFINSDSTLYKQAGNGVVVNVVREIAKKMELKKESTNGANY